MTHAPFPFFGGKRAVTAIVWQRLGRPKQYIEPFCGSAAMLLGAPEPASLEVVCDVNGFIANFWRAVKHQPGEVARWADYPVIHIDLGARHGWLMAERDYLGERLQDPEWEGDAQIAGWWLWGQCSWIGSGWCEWLGQVPHASDAGRGVQAIGKVPHASSAGRGVQALGQVPHLGGARTPGRGINNDPKPGDGVGAGLMTSAGRTAWRWLHQLADRLERVRVVHGNWDRCLNSHYGGDATAIFLDPPYRAYEAVYRSSGVADAVEAWARENAGLRVVLCGHAGDYSLDGWDVVPWTRPGHTYGGNSTTDKEALWFSPACLRPTVPAQLDLFAAEDSA